jgi:superfamily II DNA or RNA helicase
MGEEKKFGMPRADVVVIDEAHHARAKTWAAVIHHYQDAGATVLGFTATPSRGDRRGLGNIFDALVLAPQVRELIELKRLVPTIIYRRPMIDKAALAEIKVSRVTGDYEEADLDLLINRPKLVGNIVEHYVKFGQARRAVCYASSVAHSRNLQAEFERLGIPSAHIDGDTPKHERDQILARLSTGEIRVICNYGVLTEGWDCPAVACCILARPTKSFVLYRQMIGRVLRVHEESGKTNAIILDHANCTEDHDHPESDVIWHLSEDQRAEIKPRKPSNGDGGGWVECHNCEYTATQNTIGRAKLMTKGSVSACMAWCQKRPRRRAPLRTRLGC